MFYDLFWLLRSVLHCMLLDTFISDFKIIVLEWFYYPFYYGFAKTSLFDVFKLNQTVFMFPFLQTSCYINIYTKANPVVFSLQNCCDILSPECLPFDLNNPKPTRNTLKPRRKLNLFTHLYMEMRVCSGKTFELPLYFNPQAGRQLGSQLWVRNRSADLKYISYLKNPFGRGNHSTHHLLEFWKSSHLPGT